MDSEINFKDGQSRPTIPWIPPELLGHIFEHLHPDNDSGHKLRVEVALSHVSRFWRAVALATPHLWTNIDIYSNRSLSRASIYLKRSGSRLLHFNVNIYKYDKLIKTKSENKSSLLCLILASYFAKHIHRTKRLSFLCFYKKTLIFVMSAISRATAPHLQQLTLKYEIISNPRPRLPGSPFLDGGAPLLHIMDTDMIDSRSNLKCFKNLTTLYLHAMDGIMYQTYSTFIDLLRAPETLLYLSIQGAIDLATWPLHMQGSQFSLANLKGLRLLDDGMMAVKFILSLNAPQLDTLWLDCSFDNFHHLFNSPQVTGFGVGPKFPALRYLTLPNDNLHRCPQFSRLCPTITHLHFPHADFFHYSRLQEALVAGWPQLDTLVFSMFREKNSKQLHASLSNALANRSANHHPIQHLLVDKDHFEGLQGSLVIDQVKVDIIDPVLYQEAWWNKLDQQMSKTNVQ